MKTQFIADLKDGQPVATLFLVRGKEIRTSAKSNRSWLQLELSDRTGRIDAKMWDNFEELAKRFERDDVVKVRGRAKLYNDQIEITVEQIIPATEQEYELADYLPHTKEDVEKLYARLREAVAGTKNPWVKRLLASVVEDPEIAPKLKRAPAAMTMHHAYLGGLLEHMVSLIDLMQGVAEHYSELDRDLLLAGIVLHDIGKIEELNYARAISYTTEGELLGHIALGQSIVRRKIESIADFPRPLGVLIEHLILSHHGAYEFGSPRLPMSREAVALHFLDDMDSKMAAMRATLESAAGSGDWSERNPALRRNLLRTEQFLGAGETDKTAASAPEPTPRPVQRSFAVKK
ncbi:MAG: OB-fold nucleic acid binding domain-containing protein [Candidatus Acidiferrales bacterium]